MKTEEVFFLYFLLLQQYFINTQDVSLAPITIERPNWGAMFHKVRPILNGFSEYKHTFAVPWLKIEKVQLQLFVCDTDILYQEDCDRINKLITDINNTVNVRIQKLINVVERTKNDVHHISGMRKRKKRDTGHALGSDYCDKVKSSSSSSSDSSLLGTVGKVASDIFSIPSEDDIKAIASHVCDVAELADLEENEIHEANDRLTSMSNVLNKRITNIKNGITDAHNNIKKKYMIYLKM